MVDDDTVSKNGRVTTRQFYDLQLLLLDRMSAWRDELCASNEAIIEKLKAVEQKVEGNKKTARLKSDKLDIVAELAMANSDAIQEISSRIE